MPLKTFVKVGSITNLSDARYCAGMGADLLGFQVIEGHENYVTPAAYQEMRGWITGPAVVAEIYGIRHTADLNTILENYKPDYLELGEEELARLNGALPLPYILSVPVGANVTDLPVPPAYILQSTPAKISEVPTLLCIKHKDEVNQALDTPHVEGIALNGSAEIRPGLKDFESLAEILEALED